MLNIKDLPDYVKDFVNIVKEPEYSYGKMKSYEKKYGVASRDMLKIFDTLEQLGLPENMQSDFRAWKFHIQVFRDTSLPMGAAS